MAVDKELLFKPRLPEDDVEVSGVGTVRVRGLSRAETLDIKHRADGTAAVERAMLAHGLVDPQLTEEEAGRWQEACLTDELETVTGRISELSGLRDSSAKEAVKEFEANPDAEFHVLPGTEAGNDGRANAKRDAKR
jgi:hypothetical protein